MSSNYCLTCGCYHEKENIGGHSYLDNFSLSVFNTQLMENRSISIINSEELIDERLVKSTRYLNSKDYIIDIYLHKQAGEVIVSEGKSYLTQTITTLNIDPSDISYFKNIVTDLDAKIELDFNFVDTSENSDISIYYDTEIDLGTSGTVLGIASQESQKNKGWEIFINAPKLSDVRYRRYTLIHEFGHSLGLEHPFSNSDGDVVAGITDPYKSSYPEDTVMSYRNPREGIWPNQFSDNDNNALIAIWDKQLPDEYNFKQNDSANDIVINWFSSSIPNESESKDLSGKNLNIKADTWEDKIIINRVVNASNAGGLLQAKQNPAAYNRNVTGRQGSVLDGALGRDILRGLGGWDVIYGNGNDDLIHGGNGRDIIDGGIGADELHGDFGWNTFKSQEDDWADLIAIKSDQHLRNWWYGKAGNSPNGEKADFIEGLDDFDEIKIIGVSTSDLSFSKTTHRGTSGVGIYAKGTLEAVYTGGDLSVGQIKLMTTGDASLSAINNKIWSYRTSNITPDLLD